MKRKHVGVVNEPCEGLVDLQVLCMTGEGLTLNFHHSTLGQEVHRIVSQKLPCKRGAKLALHHMESRLILHKTLHEQGITSAATLSCTRLPTNVYDALCCVRGKGNADETAMQGVSELEFAPAGEYLCHLPQTLASLTFDHHFNQSLEHVTLPIGLQSLTFGVCFSQSLERVTLPSGLQSLTFGAEFNQGLERVSLPNSLQNLTFGECFNQSSSK